MREVARAFEDLRARLGDSAGPGPVAERSSTWRIGRVDRRRALAVAAFVVLVGAGAAGYAIGASQVVDVDDAEQAGMVAGWQRGTPAGARDGYESAFESARQQAFSAAYRAAYRQAYVGQFERAELAAPTRVAVPRP